MSKATEDEGLLETEYGLSQFPDKHMFGEQGALGKTAMGDKELQPDELQGLDKNNLKNFLKDTRTKTSDYADQSKMVKRTESGLVVPKTDEGVDHNINFYKTDKINKIQDQLDFCNNIQSLYIDKHEELKTVFALTLNLFQFYSYSLNVIEKLIKAYANKEVQTGFSLQKNHIIYLPQKDNTNYELQISYYSLPEVKIPIKAEINNLSEDDKNKLRSISPDKSLSDILIGCLTYSGGQGIVDNNLILKGADLLKFNLMNLSFQLKVYQAIFENINSLQPPVIEYKDTTNNDVILHITLITPSIKKIPEPSLAPYKPPPQFISTPQSETKSGPGGVVHFKKFSNIDKLKDHQKALKKQLQELHKVIIEGPKMTTSTSGGELSIQGGAKKKKTTESININEAINDLIGGDPEATIFNYHQNEIVEKETGMGNYYFVDIEGDFESLEAKNVLNLKRTDSSNNTITFTKLKKVNDDKFDKDANANTFIYSEKSAFRADNLDPINNFKKLEHSKMIELLGDVKNSQIDLNKPIVFDSEFYKSEVYKSLFTFTLN